MTAEVAAQHRTLKARRWRSPNWAAITLLAPAVLVLLVITIYPLGFAVTTSLRQYSLTQPYLGTPFVGLDNYRTVLSDSTFWQSLERTAEFFVLTVPAELVLGIAIALLLDRSRWPRLQSVVRVALTLPIAVTPAVLGLIGRLLYNRDFGLIDWALVSIHLPRVSWLGDPSSAMVAIAMTDVWQWTPFVALIALAGLSLVPDDILESARLDTSSGWGIFRHLQLPYLLPGITAVLIIRTADILKLFDMIFTLTRGGPGISTELVSLYIQRVGLRVFDMGVASAQAILLLVLCIVLSRAYLRFFYRGIEV